MANNYYKSQFDTYITFLEPFAGGVNALPYLADGKIRELYPPLSEPKNALLNQRKVVAEAAKDQYLACMLLVG